MKRRRNRYEVVNTPEPWRRSLVESGMERATTRTDRIVVGVFFVLLVGVIALLVWAASSYA